MAAGVHMPGMGGTIRPVGRLFERERIDVGTQRHIPARSPAAVQKRDDIGSEERRKHFKPENGEPFPDQLRGFEFLPGHLRNPVQGVAEFDDSGQNVRKRLHSSQ